MGKKIFAVLLLLSFTCAGLQAQNNKNKSKERTLRDKGILEYVPIRKGSDSVNRAQTIQELARKEEGVASLATILATFKPFILPPIDELFERAKNNPLVVYRQHEAERAWRDVVTAKRTWMKWFSGNAAYSYGKYNSNLYFQQTNIPTANSYSNQNTSYYLAGASVQVNLFELVNINNLVKQEKEHYKSIEYQVQADWADVMEKISKSYYNIQYSLPLISHGVQWAKLAELSYEDAKLDFIAGRKNTVDLYDTEANYYRAIQELGSMIKNVNIDVKALELLTNSKILPDEDVLPDVETYNGSTDVTSKGKDVVVPSNSEVVKQSGKKSRKEIREEKRRIQKSQK